MGGNWQAGPAGFGLWQGCGMRGESRGATLYVLYKGLRIVARG